MHGAGKIDNLLTEELDSSYGKDWAQEEGEEEEVEESRTSPYI